MYKENPNKRFIIDNGAWNFRFYKNGQ